MIREKGDEVFEMIESTMWESALRTLKTLTNELETTHSQIEHDDKLDKSKLYIKSPQPIIYSHPFCFYPLKKKLLQR